MLKRGHALAFILVALFSMTIVLAQEVNFGYNENTLPAQTNFSNESVNFSEFAEIWITDEGDMDNVPDLYSTLDLIYCQLIGCTMTGDLLMTNLGDIVGDGALDIYTTLGKSFALRVDDDGENLTLSGLGTDNIQLGDNLVMNSNNINEVANITVQDRIFIGNTDHFIKSGAEEEFLGISDQAIWIDQKEEHSGGTIVFLVSSNKTNSDIDGISIMAQIGRNHSAGVLGNSWMVMPNNLTNNLTILSDCFLVASELNKTIRVACDTADTGADFIVQDDIQSFGRGFFGEGIRSENEAQFVMNGFNFDLSGDLHLRTRRIEEVGFPLGDNVTLLTVDFSAGLTPFELITLSGSPNEWIDVATADCFEAPCARASRITPPTDSIMETNFTTTDFDSLNLSFRINTTNLDANDLFNVTVNNNVGSGEVELYSISANANTLVSVILPASMDDKSSISLRYHCNVNVINEQCLVDNVIVVGTATSNTLTNVTRFDTVIKGGPTSDDQIFLRYNDSVKQWQFSPDSVSFTNVTEVLLNVTDFILVGLGQVKLSTPVNSHLSIGDLGTATTHSLDTNEDVLVEGELEVDGASYFDNPITITGSNPILNLVSTGGDDWLIDIKTGSFRIRNTVDGRTDLSIGGDGNWNIGTAGTTTNAMGTLKIDESLIVLGTSATVNGKDVCLNDSTNCPAITNIFDQSLNTTDDVIFNSVEVSLINSSGDIHIRPSGDTDDPFNFSTNGNLGTLRHEGIRFQFATPSGDFRFFDSDTLGGTDYNSKVFLEELILGDEGGVVEGNAGLLNLVDSHPTVRIEGVRNTQSGLAFNFFDLYARDNAVDTSFAQKFGVMGIFGQVPNSTVGSGVEDGVPKYVFVGAGNTTAFNNVFAKFDAQNRLGLNIPSSARPDYPLHVLNNVSGITIWSEANVSATGYNERTSVYNSGGGPALSNLFNASDVIKPDGSINHLLLDGGRCYNATDYNKPVSTGWFNITGFELDEVFEYPFEIEVCDMSRSEQINKHEQALFDMYDVVKEQQTMIDLLKSELCDRDLTYQWCLGLGGGG